MVANALEWTFTQSCSRTNIGAIYDIGWARPTFGSARAGRWKVHHLYLFSGTYLNQKFHVIIAANASSVCYTSRLKLCVPGSGCRRNDSDYAKPRSALLWSGAERG